MIEHELLLEGGAAPSVLQLKAEPARRRAAAAARSTAAACAVCFRLSARALLAARSRTRSFFSSALRLEEGGSGSWPRSIERAAAREQGSSSRAPRPAAPSRGARVVARHLPGGNTPDGCHQRCHQRPTRTLGRGRAQQGVLLLLLFFPRHCQRPPSRVPCASHAEPAATSRASDGFDTHGRRRPRRRGRVELPERLIWGPIALLLLARRDARVCPELSGGAAARACAACLGCGRARARAQW